jgi:hypothetical protein
VRLTGIKHRLAINQPVVLHWCDAVWSVGGGVWGINFSLNFFQLKLSLHPEFTFLLDLELKQIYCSALVQIRPLDWLPAEQNGNIQNLFFYINLDN